MSNTAASLLSQATALLSDATGYSNRAACWIARAALESTVDELLAGRGRSAPEASMRSKLSVLQVAYVQQPDLTEKAEYAWSGLSRACHQHAFELTPAASEVHHLIALVGALIPSPDGDHLPTS